MGNLLYNCLLELLCYIFNKMIICLVLSILLQRVKKYHFQAYLEVSS